jgi:hypothetical protein
MEVTPISGRVTIVPVAPVKRVSQVRKGQKRARSEQSEEADKPTPELAPGQGQNLDIYV